MLPRPEVQVTIRCGLDLATALADEFDGILASYDDLDSKVKQERISAAMAKYAKMFMYLWD